MLPFLCVRLPAECNWPLVSPPQRSSCSQRLTKCHTHDKTRLPAPAWLLSRPSMHLFHVAVNETINETQNVRGILTSICTSCAYFMELASSSTTSLTHTTLRSCCASTDGYGLRNYYQAYSTTMHQDVVDVPFEKCISQPLQFVLTVHPC